MTEYGYSLAVDMRTLGFETSVWVKRQEEFNSDDHLYDIGLLNAHEWFSEDPQVFKLMKSYNYSEEDIYTFRDIYESLIDPHSYVRVVKMKALMERLVSISTVISDA